jgi:ABC-type phosphonate transport system ATPase subunit
MADAWHLSAETPHIRHLSKRFGRFVALAGVLFAVRPREVLGIIGLSSKSDSVREFKAYVVTPAK